MRQLRAERLDFEQIRRRLAVEEAAEAKARAEAAAAPPPAPSSDVVETPTPQPLAAGGGDTWQRIVLVPGMELHVRVDGGALLQRLATEIRASYGIAGGRDDGSAEVK